MRRLGLFLVLVFASICALAGSARADGFIIILPPEPPPIIFPPYPHPIPPPPPRPVFFPLAVKHHRVTVNIADRIATTEIDQVFTNPNPADLEGTYIFPLPEDASIAKFSLFMNGKEVEAELLDAGKARQIYENIVRQMRDPALLEYAGRGLFKARIYPIPGRGDARVRLSYQQVIRAEAGLCEYRYPLSTEKFSSAPLDEARVEVNLSASAAAGVVGNIFSPSHAVTIERRADGTARAVWHEHRTTPDRDFVLYFQRGDKEREIDVTAVAHRSAGEDGYFLLLLAPPFFSDGDDVPKDVVFVLDTSGSMAGPKMDQAKAALRYCVRSLRPKDRFAIVDFATEVRTFREGLVDVKPEALLSAESYVDNMRARGGTDIHGALLRALEIQGTSGRPFMIVFITDGEPTIGVTIPADIEKAVKSAREARPDRDDVRLFVFGVGTDLNAALLDRLAEANRGAREYVAPEESIEVKVSRFFDKVASPVFSDVRIDLPGLEAYDIYPRPIPDLFRGGEVAVVGRYRGAGTKAVHLKGKLRGHATEVLAKLDFPEERSAAFLPRVFAVRKVAFLLDQIRLHGEKDELRKEVVRLAKEFGIVTPYTSYLVIEDEKQLGMRGNDAPARQALERLRADDEFFARAEAEAKAAAQAAAAPAGEKRESADSARIVAASEAARRMAEAPLSGATAPGEEYAGAAGSIERFRKTAEPAPAWSADKAKERLQEAVRVIEGRTFYRSGEVWVDARIKAGAEVERIPYLSEAYFKLVAERPEIGRFLALGPRVRLLAGAKAIEVTLGE